MITETDVLMSHPLVIFCNIFYYMIVILKTINTLNNMLVEYYLSKLHANYIPAQYIPFIKTHKSVITRNIEMLKRVEFTELTFNEPMSQTFDTI